jgi:glycine cleavage system pyridoxal-binding protein P
LTLIVEMIRTMGVVDAEKLINALVPEQIEEIRKLIMEEEEEREIGQHYKLLPRTTLWPT